MTHLSSLNTETTYSDIFLIIWWWLKNEHECDGSTKGGRSSDEFEDIGRNLRPDGRTPVNVDVAAWNKLRYWSRGPVKT